MSIVLFVGYGLSCVVTSFISLKTSTGVEIKKKIKKRRLSKIPG